MNLLASTNSKVFMPYVLERNVRSVMFVVLFVIRAFGVPLGLIECRRPKKAVCVVQAVAIEVFCSFPRVVVCLEDPSGVLTCIKPNQDKVCGAEDSGKVGQELCCFIGRKISDRRAQAHQTCATFVVGFTNPFKPIVIGAMEAMEADVFVRRGVQQRKGALQLR